MKMAVRVQQIVNIPTVRDTVSSERDTLPTSGSGLAGYPHPTGLDASSTKGDTWNMGHLTHCWAAREVSRWQAWHGNT